MHSFRAPQAIFCLASIRINLDLQAEACLGTASIHLDLQAEAYLGTACHNIHICYAWREV